MSSNDLTTSELEQLISSITFFQLGARVKEMRTIKIKLKNQLKLLLLTEQRAPFLLKKQQEQPQ